MSVYDDFSDCKIVEGKMSIPLQYFAGRVGSKFIISLRDAKKILGVKCPKCDKVYCPPREYCEKDMTKLDENWVELGNEGVVENFTIVRKGEKHHPRRAPFILALVKVDGADTPFAHIVEGVAPEDMKVGLRVKAVYAKETTNSIMDLDHFEPVEA